MPQTAAALEDINRAVLAAQTAAAQAQAAAAQATSRAVSINQMAATALFWAGTWDSNKFYTRYSVVVLSDILYTSLIDGNKGHSPDSSPSQWQAFGAAGGAPAPDSSITGLDLHLVDGTPTLRETPEEIATFTHGLSVGETSDDADPMLAIGPGQLSVSLGSGDQMNLSTTNGHASLVMSGAAGEIDINGEVLDLSSNGDLHLTGEDLEITGDTVINMTSPAAVNINGGGGGTVTLGGGGGDTINIAHNSADTFHAGLTSDGQFPMISVGPEEFLLLAGPLDTVYLGTVTDATHLSIYEEEIDVYAPTIRVGGDGNGSTVSMGVDTGDTLHIGGDDTLISVFGATPVGQQSGGEAEAGDSYSSNEQNMLNVLWNASRAYGWLS